MSTLLLSFQGEHQRCALLEDGLLVDYREAVSVGGPQTEDIYLGRANRVMKALGAVFVKLDKQAEGFLPFAQIPGGSVPRPGEALLVQVKKPRMGDKAAYLTADIALPGRYAMLLPRGAGWRLSRRVSDEEQRARLLDVARRIAPAGMGLVLREESVNAPEDVIALEVEGLLALWQTLEAKANAVSAPAEIHTAPGALERLLREVKDPIDTVVSDDVQRAADVGLQARFAADPMGLYNVPGHLRRALRRRVRLKSGAELVIDPCEALTLIDVNSAQSVKGKDHEQAILQTNLEAAHSIARLLRLRRIGGIVIIDFIDMVSQEDRQAVIDALRQGFAKDPSKTVIHGFTQLGLLEMTRKKTDEALAVQPMQVCIHCGGTGRMEDIDPDDA